jgi:hypothetical protein
MVSEMFKDCDMTPYNLVGDYKFFREHVCFDLQSKTKEVFYFITFLPSYQNI